MRTWIWGGCLAAITASGVYFVFAGTSATSHCGPCVAASKPCCQPATEEATTPVVSVVDVPTALTPIEPNRLPFISFDEPPFAQPIAPATVPDIIPAAFTEPVTAEVAPMPCPVGEANRLPLAQPNDPF